ncbi:MAG TPA: (2Fe-2S)-binding protein [Frankiaceae bacterium]|nr:(2Fe-2S)-binding protein [Frankiaceae bacterium]
MILALREAAALGPFFTLALPGEAAAEADWHPFTQLGAPAGVALLADQISRLGEFLATDEERAVASILHLGAASAICAPLLATAALAGTIPSLEPGQLRFGFQGNGPLRLALDSLPPDAPRALLPALADALIGVVLDGLLASFTIALTKAVAVPENTLQGNVFSALAAAARLVTPASAGARARALADLVSRRYLPLHDAGTLDWRAVDSPDPQSYFRRRNCCLFYRVSGGGICGDCILTP